MTSNISSIIHILQDLRKNIINSYVDRNYSPKEIIAELKKLNLNYSGTKESEIESNVLNGIHKKWNEDKRVWEEDKQTNMFVSLNVEDEKRFWNSYLTKLSPNQGETLLNDMKEILSNVKQITKAAERITWDIDYIVAKVKEYDEEK